MPSYFWSCFNTAFPTYCSLLPTIMHQLLPWSTSFIELSGVPPTFIIPLILNIIASDPDFQRLQVVWCRISDDISPPERLKRLFPYIWCMESRNPNQPHQNPGSQSVHRMDWRGWDAILGTKARNGSCVVYGRWSYQSKRPYRPYGTAMMTPTTSIRIPSDPRVRVTTIVRTF